MEFRLFHGLYAATIEYREISTMNFIDGATIELTGGTSYFIFEKHPIYEHYTLILNSVDLNLGAALCSRALSGMVIYVPVPRVRTKNPWNGAI